ncbi:uncharacterized protein LOC143461113 isoform X1 [Clavelina lepadiformis]|uniref:uncharacterized protein LOC143461113 isoform X1 n=1 Tax=Clavelina lepadiformis TaxID=159417 RepID=UPI004041A72D
MSSTYIKRYHRCKWMAVVSAIFTVMTIACLIPGAIGVAGLNHYNDTLLYLGLIDFIFAALFFTGWWSCQIEVDDVTQFTGKVPVARQVQKKRESVCSQTSADSMSTHQLIQIGVARGNIKEA